MNKTLDLLFKALETFKAEEAALSSAERLAYKRELKHIYRTLHDVHVDVYHLKNEFN